MIDIETLIRRVEEIYWNKEHHQSVHVEWFMAMALLRLTRVAEKLIESKGE